MADRMWADFCARYPNVKRDDLARVPALNTAWAEWQVAWTAGADAALEQDDDGLMHRNEDAGRPDCPWRDD